MADNVEQVGFSAVLKGVVEYVSNSKKMAAANREIKKSIDDVSRVAAANKFSIGGVSQFSSQQRTFFAQQAISAQALRAQYTTLAASNKALVGTFGQLARQAPTAVLGKLGSSFVNLRNAVQGSSLSLSKMAFILGRLQFVIISVGAALATLGAPVILAAKFEESIGKIDRLTQVADKDLNTLRESILDISREFGRSPADVAAAGYFILSRGIKDAATATELLRLATGASVIGLGDASEVAQVLTSILNAYQLTAKDAAIITDQLIQAVTVGGSEAADFAGSIGRVIPLAAQMGVEFTQVGAILATLTNQGLNADESVTALLGVLTHIIKRSAEADEVFKILGIDIVQFQKDLDENAVKAFGSLANLAQTNTEVFSQLFQERRGLVGFLAAFTRQLPMTEANLNAVSNAQGAWNRELLEAQQTTKFKFNKALANFQTALIRLGTTLLPMTSKALGGISHWIDQISADGPRLFKDWEPTLRQAGSILQEIFDLLKRIADFVSGNQGGLILAGLGAAGIFAWAVPGGPVLLGLGLMIGAIAILTTDLDEMGLSALKVRLVLLNLVNDILTGVADIQSGLFGGKFLGQLADIPGLSPKMKLILEAASKLQEGLANVIPEHSRLDDAQKISQNSIDATTAAIAEQTKILNESNRFINLNTDAFTRQASTLIDTARTVKSGNFLLSENASALALVNKKVAAGVGFNQALVQSLNVLKIPLGSVAAAEIAVAAAAGAAGIGLSDLTGFMITVGREAAAQVIKIQLYKNSLLGIFDIAGQIAGFRNITKSISAFGAAFGFGGSGANPFTSAGDLGLGFDTGGASAADAAAEINPFDEFVKQEDIREMLLKIGTTGNATWQEVARLWSLGAKDAANELAKVLRGEIEGLGDTAEEAFRNVATRFMGELERGIIEGTVTVLDAIQALEAGLVDSARSIVESLALQAKNITEQWEILVRTLESGVTSLADVERLFEIGATDSALELLRLMAGQPNILSDPIRKFKTNQNLPFFPTAQMHSGGFVPAGQTTSAMLHGPEAVIPLGSQGAMMGALAKLSGSLGGIGGMSGFRNYGQVSISTSNNDDRLLRAMSRALRAG